MIGAIKKAALFAWDVLIPRVVTEDVALLHTGDGDGWDAFEIVCSMSDVEPGETFDGIGEVDSFSWLGLGVTYRIGKFRPWGSNP